MSKRTNVLTGNALADDLLRGLSKEKQIEWLTEKLTKPSDDGEEELDLLEGLAMVFDNKVAFRTQLGHIYIKLITVESGLGFPRVETTKFPKLAIAIVKKILEGWEWEWKRYGDCLTNEYYKRAKRVLQRNPDARDCFQFFCQIYQHANERLAKLMVEVFHEHINARREFWQTEDLNEWILAEGVPSSIIIILAGARIRIGGSGLAKREISLSQSFQTQLRSPEAAALITNQMRIVRQTEDLARTLVEKVRSSNEYGDINPERVVPWEGVVEWSLESAEVARVKITFRPVLDPKTRGNYSKSIADVQAVRDQLLSGVKNPPRILIEVEGPDGFNYKEE